MQRERTIKSDKIYHGKIINLRIDTVELPDKKYSKREIVEHPGAVGIVAITDENKIIMVKQFRKAVEETLLEIPAAKIEIGEDIIECAKRELLEETGYICGSLEHLLDYYPSPGFSNEIIRLFIARDLVKDKAQPDEDEDILTEEYDIEELYNLIRDKKIRDGKTIIALLFIKDSIFKN